MDVIKVGDRIVFTESVYKNSTGTITEVHEDKWDSCMYGVMLDVPVTVEIAFQGNVLGFEDHSNILAKPEDIQLLTELGEVIYGEQEDDSNKTL